MIFRRFNYESDEKFQNGVIHDDFLRLLSFLEQDEQREVIRLAETAYLDCTEYIYSKDRGISLNTIVLFMQPDSTHEQFLVLAIQENWRLPLTTTRNSVNQQSSKIAELTWAWRHIQTCPMTALYLFRPKILPREWNLINWYPARNDCIF